MLAVKTKNPENMMKVLNVLYPDLTDEEQTVILDEMIDIQKKQLV